MVYCFIVAESCSDRNTTCKQNRCRDSWLNIWGMIDIGVECLETIFFSSQFLRQWHSLQSLSHVMDASMEDLARCPGIGERKVAFHVIHVYHFVFYSFFLSFCAHCLLILYGFVGLVFSFGEIRRLFVLLLVVVSDHIEEAHLFPAIGISIL